MCEIEILDTCPNCDGLNLVLFMEQANHTIEACTSCKTAGWEGVLFDNTPGVIGDDGAVAQEQSNKIIGGVVRLIRSTGCLQSIEDSERESFHARN